jgi:hypothetical protein
LKKNGTDCRSHASRNWQNHPAATGAVGRPALASGDHPIHGLQIGIAERRE